MPKAKHCIECGAALPDAVPGGFCPACALRGALTSGSGEKADDRDQKSEVSGPARTGNAPHATSFGDYELLEEIARGGMGVVWKARQKSLNRIVALKMMLSGQFARPEFVQRFRAEAEAIAQLQHPNIVAIHEVGEREGQPYFSMDFVQGRTLADIVREGPLPAQRAATYLKAIAEAVHYAHQHHILHRDLKPSNVLIDASDQPRITDFGLAKRLDDAQLSTTHHQLTLTGQVLGSPNYLSPEQAAGRQAEVGTTSDVYALGAMLYHLVTGRPPFQADSLTTLLGQVMEAEPVSPRLLNVSIPRDLETICLKCLEKEPTRRYASAQAVADELGRVLRKEPILARPVSRPEKVWRWCRRKPALATALGAVVLVAAVGFAGIVTQWRRAEEQRRNAESNELLARQNAYAADMNLAQRALEANDVGLAVSLLNKYRPDGKSATDLRHWEWRYLWQRCRSDELFRLHQYPDWINTVAVTKDGRVLAVLRGTAKVTLWDLTTKRCVTELPGADYRALALSPTGSLLAVSRGHAQGEPAVELWDVKALALRTTLPCPAPVRSLAFSPDETLLATFDNEGTTTVVEWESKRDLTHFTAPRPRRGGQVGVVVFSPDGVRLAIGEDFGKIRIVNWRTGTAVPVETHTSDGVMALAFSPTDELLVAGFAYSSGTIRLWDAHSGAPRGQMTNHTDWIYELAFTPDGRLLASASADRTIRVWRVADQAELRCLQGSQDRVTGLALLPDGRTLVSGGNDGAISFWDINASRRASGYTNLTISLGADSSPKLDAQGLAHGAVNPKWERRLGFAFTPDGRSFITTDRDCALGVWDAQSVQRKESLPALGSNNWGLALSPKGRWLAVGNASGKVHIWDWAVRRLVVSLEVPFERDGLLRFSHSGRFLLAKVTLFDRTVKLKIWWTEDWQEISLAGIQVAGIESAGLSPDDRFLAAGYANGAVTLWSFPSGQDETTFGKHRATVNEVLFSPDGRVLASASSDGCAKLWGVSTGQELTTLRGHSSWVWGATFLADGRRLATGATGAKDAVKLWDTVARRELLSLPAKGQFFAYLTVSPDGNTLVATSVDGMAHFWHAPSWAEIEAAEKGEVTP